LEHGLLALFTALLVLVGVFQLIKFLIALPKVDQISERYVLVTGCGRGIGYEIVRRLDEMGCHVFAACRSQRGLAELDAVTSQRCHVFEMDISKSESVRKGFEVVKARLPPGKGLWGLVNNAGITGSKHGLADWLEVSDYQEVLDVNLLGTIHVTETFMPLVKLERGRVVMMSSIIARFILQIFFPYGISKYALEAYSDGLRRQLHIHGCSVHQVEPGLIATDLTSDETIVEGVKTAWNCLPQSEKDKYGPDYADRMSKYVRFILNFPTFNRISSVVSATTHALFDRYPRARYLVGNDAYLFYLPLSVLPEWASDWIFNFLARLPLPRPTKPDPSQTSQKTD
jgi:NAD(P)-dependent dehydrogenase (short-subunit alcohol dehydrogenase family)